MIMQLKNFNKLFIVMGLTVTTSCVQIRWEEFFSETPIREHVVLTGAPLSTRTVNDFHCLALKADESSIARVQNSELRGLLKHFEVVLVTPSQFASPGVRRTYLPFDFSDFDLSKIKSVEGILETGFIGKNIDFPSYHKDAERLVLRVLKVK